MSEGGVTVWMIRPGRGAHRVNGSISAGIPGHSGGFEGRDPRNPLGAARPSNAPKRW